MSGYRDAILFVVLALLWGGTFTAIEVGLTAHPPVLFAAWRFDLGAVTLLSLVLAGIDDPWPRTGADLRAIVAGGVLFIAANSVFLFVGQLYVTGSVAAIVYSLVPVMTAVFAGVLLDDETLGLGDVAGVCLGLVGVAFVARPSPTAIDTAGVTVGVALVFVAVVAVALGSVLIQRVDAPSPTIAVTAWSLVLGAICLHVASAALGEPVVLSTAPGQLLALAFLGVAATTGAFPIYFDLLDRLGSFQANLISYLVPVVATVVGWALLAEEVTPLAVVGFVLIFLGFLVVKRRRVRQEVAGLAAP